ncbi:MAG: hypothetical protein ACT4PT_01890 [Methanobacteriota archaeon]
MAALTAIMGSPWMLGTDALGEVTAPISEWHGPGLPPDMDDASVIAFPTTTAGTTDLVSIAEVVGFLDGASGCAEICEDCYENAVEVCGKGNVSSVECVKAWECSCGRHWCWCKYECECKITCKDSSDELLTLVK